MLIKRGLILVMFLLVLVIGWSPLQSITQEDDDFLPELTPMIYYALEDVALVARLGHGLVTNVAWSPDGTTLAVATSAGLWLYNANDLAEDPILLEVDVYQVAFSPDGSYMASGGDPILIWDTADYSVIASININGTPLSMAFSPDSTQLVTSNTFGSEEYGVWLWDVATGRLVAQLADRQVLSELSFSDDGAFLAGVALSDCCFATIVWDMTTLQELYTQDMGTMADEDSVAFDPNNNQTLVIFDRTGSFRVWDLATNDLAVNVFRLESVYPDWYPVEADFFADGAMLMSVSMAGVLRLWDYGTLELTNEIDLGVAPRSAVLDPTGERLVTIEERGNIRIWETRTGSLLDQRDNLSMDSQFVLFSPDGSLLASRGNTTEIWLWDMVTGKIALRLMGHTDAINSVSFSPDGTRLASASNDGTVRIWDTTTGEQTEVFLEGDVPFTFVIFNQDGLLLVANADNLIQVYDLATDQPVELYYDEETQSSVYQIEFSDTYPVITDIAFRDMNIAISTRFGDAHMSSPFLEQVEEIGRDGYGRAFNAIAIDPQDPSAFVTVGDNQVVQLWSTREPNFGVPLTPHNSWTYAVDYNAEGLLLASGGCATTEASPWDGSLYCAGGELRLWDVFFSRHHDLEISNSGIIRDVDFNADTTLLASISDNGTIVLWGLLVEED